MVLFRGSGPSGELSWWGILLGIVVPVGNGWALFLSGGELSSVMSVGSCPIEPPFLYAKITLRPCIFPCNDTVVTNTRIFHPYLF